MFETLKNAFKVKEIRKKIFIMLALLLVYRIGCYIPVPGLRSSVFSEYVEDGGNNFLALMSAVTGGALANGTLFALGIGPYINASIIMQLLAVGIPALERLSKQGEEGKKKIATYTRILTLVLAIVQAIGVIINFASTRNAINFTYFWDQEWLTYIYMAVVYTGGAMITMWLGERITEYGVGNGISMIIFIGIISTAGNQLIIAPIQNTVESGFSASTLVSTIVFIVIAIVIFALIVLVDLAERRIPVQYAKQVKGRKMYGGQATVIPIKISGSGVMPLIFAFSFFYAQIQFNPEDISKSIQQNGGFIPGIRPGKPTADYLKKISNRITLFGAIFLSLVAFVPSFAFSFAGAGYVNVFSTTGILIIVSVALEFDKQLQSQLMMKNYKGFLK